VRLLRYSALLFALVAQTGCVYWALGVKHNRAVAGNLSIGMSRAEALATVSDGGSIAVRPEMPRPDSGHWADSIESDAVLAMLLLSEERQRRPIVVVLPVSRTWGFMGLGVFHLFFDEGDHLVGYHLLHIN